MSKQHLEAWSLTEKWSTIITHILTNNIYEHLFIEKFLRSPAKKLENDWKRMEQETEIDIETDTETETDICLFVCLYVRLWEVIFSLFIWFDYYDLIRARLHAVHSVLCYMSLFHCMYCIASRCVLNLFNISLCFCCHCVPCKAEGV